jgi:hypothetical protein
MKNCAYCGRENAEEALACRECGTAEFVAASLPAPPEPHQVETAVEPAEPEPDVPADGESALCTYCVFPNLPEASSCKRCGAALNYPAIVGPIEAAHASGFMWRGALRGRPKPFVLLSIWVIFLPSLIINVGSAFSILAGSAGGAIALPFFWLSLFFAAVCFTMLYRVTRNYLTLPAARSHEGVD